MTANKMPELPEAAKIIYANRRNTASVRSGAELGGYVKERWYTADQMRAMYLAGLEAAKACVPTNWCDPLLTGDKAVIGKPPYGCPDIEAILGGILANLTALEQEAKK